MIARMAYQREVQLREIELHAKRAQEAKQRGDHESAATHIGIALCLRRQVEDQDRRNADAQVARDIIAAATQHPSPRPVRLGVKALLASVILRGGSW